jgi:5-methyltetrahydrofolate--homocysteine methyltransferase
VDTTEVRVVWVVCSFSKKQEGEVSESLGAIARAVELGDHRQTVALVTQALAAAVPPVVILKEGLVPGMQALASAFRGGQAYLPDVLIAARAMKRGVGALSVVLPRSEMQNAGKVVLGTVFGDMHDIGKNLVGMMLDCGGFDVLDLGVDVAAERFVEAAREHGADIVAVSALLTTTMPYMRDVVRGLRQAGLTSRVLIGGAAVTDAWADEIGADGFAEDCTSAVDAARRLMVV